MHIWGPNANRLCLTSEGLTFEGFPKAKQSQKNTMPPKICDAFARAFAHPGKTAFFAQEGVQVMVEYVESRFHLRLQVEGVGRPENIPSWGVGAYILINGGNPWAFDRHQPMMKTTVNFKPEDAVTLRFRKAATFTIHWPSVQTLASKYKDGTCQIPTNPLRSLL